MTSRLGSSSMSGQYSSSCEAAGAVLKKVTGRPSAVERIVGKSLTCVHRHSILFVNVPSNVAIFLHCDGIFFSLRTHAYLMMHDASSHAVRYYYFCQADVVVCAACMKPLVLYNYCCLTNVE